MAPHDIPEKELKNVLSSTMTMGIMRKVFILLNTRVWEQQSTLIAVLKQKLNACLCQVHPTRKMSKLLLLHDNTSTHWCVHHCTVLAHLPYVLTL